MLYTFKVAVYDSISHLKVLVKRWHFCSAWCEFISAQSLVLYRHYLWLGWREGTADHIWKSNLSEAVLTSVYQHGGLCLVEC